MKRLLRPLSLLYTFITSLRNYLYDRDIFRNEWLPVPVISVGNLSVGGTGKTPLVKKIAEDAVRSGKTTAIVSRGYKRKSKGELVVSRGNGPKVSVGDAGDEPYMLSYFIPEAVIIVNSDRVAAAKTAHKTFHADIILMDDGFQHRRLGRKYDIVVVPAEDILSKEKVLPEGRLRESWKGLSRATHIVVPGLNTNNADFIKEFVRKYSSGRIIPAEKQTVPVLKNPHKNQSIPLDRLSETPKIYGIAGIGQPEKFQKDLREMRMELIAFRSYADHYSYSREDQYQILDNFAASEADYLVMTAKDFVKWDADLLRKNPLFYIPLNYEIPDSFLLELQ